MSGIWSFYLPGGEDRTHDPKEGTGHCGPETSFLLAEAGAGAWLRAQRQELNRRVGKESRKAHGPRGDAGISGSNLHLPPSSLDKAWQRLLKQWNDFPFPACTLAHKSSSAHWEFRSFKSWGGVGGRAWNPPWKPRGGGRSRVFQLLGGKGCRNLIAEKGSSG